MNEQLFGPKAKIVGATVHSDQLAVVSNCANLNYTSNEKRLRAAFHYIRQCVAEGAIADVRFAPSDLNISDGLTKPTSAQALMYLAQQNILITPDTASMSGKKRAKRNNALFANCARPFF